MAQNRSMSVMSDVCLWMGRTEPPSSLRPSAISKAVSMQVLAIWHQSSQLVAEIDSPLRRLFHVLPSRLPQLHLYVVTTLVAGTSARREASTITERWSRTNITRGEEPERMTEPEKQEGMTELMKDNFRLHAERCICCYINWLTNRHHL